MNKPETVPFFRWREHYRVGIEKFDREHEEIAALLNQLHDSVQAGRQHGMAGPILDKMIRALKKHFRTEEEMMEQYRYPRLEGHRADHRALARKLGDFQKEFAEGNAVMDEPYLSGLKDWLRDHMLLADKPFGSFLEVRRLV